MKIGRNSRNAPVCVSHTGMHLVKIYITFAAVIGSCSQQAARIKRESGLNPELSRSCKKLHEMNILDLHATARDKTGAGRLPG